MTISLLVKAGALGAIAAAALSVSSLVAQAQQTIRIGFASGSVGPHAAGANAFKAELEKLAPGRFKVELFPGGSLGGEREMAESIQLGSLEMAITGTAVLGNFVPDMMVIDIPFLFRDYDHARSTMDGPVGQQLLAKMRERGLVGLAFGEVGFRHFTNSKHPITKLDDLKGLKIRSQENAIHLESFRALGAQPTPMSWTEVVPALQQGTIDGQENPLSITVSAKLWESQKYMTLSKHAFTPVAFYMSPALFNSLSKEDQAIIQKAAEAGRAGNRKYIDDSERDGVELIKKNGMQVNELDATEFRKRLEPLYTKYKARFGKLVDEIQAK